ncbi:hypothetical protein CC1G_06641 [Coprinopsis cinerea okayama7|uniref:AB hydrolase-1 domain-containing protein n=1 Tax=Coprinopsis cinerea (strain Okayama-7 / 130 / ATCC MYA-4618 / FGSC 9003) TaxID=240176 RepID=A8P7U5_COPC7|nr:hypothetical protein CC1G_06641 [Coprinopsis cinerea okayama7\|eukprot:XP_001839428.1 hypothetical protein CC1G_06641 [Coprinopsis cinerea okayama7\
MTTAAQSHTVTSSDGTSIYATAVGNPDLPSLVFIHGFSLSCKVFEPLFKDSRLLERFYLVAFDVRGHARSGKPLTPEGYETRLFADDFKAVSDHFKLKKPIVVGWSLGGLVITDIFAHLPMETVSAVVYLNSIPWGGAAIPQVATAETLAILPQVLGATGSVDDTFNARVRFIETCFNDPSDNVPINLKWEWLGTGVTQPPSVAGMVVGRAQDESKLVEAGKAGLPVLHIYGTKDRAINGSAVEGILRQTFTALEVHKIEGGSHSPFADDGFEETVVTLEKFASKIFA